MNYSIVVPVFNRPLEVADLLESLVKQTYKEFEIVIVEDGSHYKSDRVISRYKDVLNIKYYEKANEGPGLARNYGVDHSSGDYIIILDSDVILPEQYLEVVDRCVNAYDADVFTAPDEAHQSFNEEQKAINFAMTSVLTTGGIRSRKTMMDKHYPRSFNMGMKRSVFQDMGGFSAMRFGEDIELGARLHRMGYHTFVFEDAFVYHKRRSTFTQFFKQVFNSGIARINLYKRYPETLKMVHYLPAFFVLASALFLLSLVVNDLIVKNIPSVKMLIEMQDFVPILSGFMPDIPAIYSVLLKCINFVDVLQNIYLVFFIAYILAIFILSSLKNGILVGLLSVPASLIQIVGYGTGFIKGYWKRCIRKGGEFEAYKDSFYN